MLLKSDEKTSEFDLPIAPQIIEALKNVLAFGQVQRGFFGVHISGILLKR